MWTAISIGKSNESLRFMIHSAEAAEAAEALERKERRANGGCLGYPEAKKVVVSCEKARGTANRF